MRRFRSAVLAAALSVALATASTPAAARSVGREVDLRGGPTSASSPGAGAPARASAVPGVLLVKTRPSKRTPLATLDALPGVSASDVRPGRNRTAAVKTPTGKSDAEFLAQLKASPDVEYAEPNYIRRLAYAVPPNDPDYLSGDAFAFGGSPPIHRAKSWWLRDLNGNSGMDVESVWGALEGAAFAVRAPGSAKTVAVIDSGLYATHPDAGANIVGGKDEFATYTASTGILTTDDDVTPVDPGAPLNEVQYASHGTCVAGQISAGTDNGVGVAGASYDTSVVVYKVQGVWTDGAPAEGYPPGCAVIFDEAVINAIYDATDAGAKVINISIAGPDYSSVMQDAIDYAWANGVLVVAATGNSGTYNGVQYPAANKHVVGVGSYAVTGTGSKTRSSFTDFGIGCDPSAGPNNGQIDLLAPGQWIYGLIQPGYDHDGPGDAYAPGYYWWSGTSMASPAFAGMAAMMWRFSPELTPDELATLFYASAVNAGDNLGYGYLNLTGAYAKLKANYPYLLAPATLYLPPATNDPEVPVSWTPVTGRAVSYDIHDNGAFLKNLTSTSTTLTLAEGSHEVSVTPRSVYNWWDPATTKTGTVVVDLDLAPVTLTGTVKHKGAPLAGVSVSVPGTATVTTSASGEYTVGGVFPGTHTVTYAKSGYVTQTRQVPVGTDPTTAAPDVDLDSLSPIHRFYNKRNGSHFYTASEAEKESVIANLSAIYALDGVAYRVSSAYATPLHRFYNKQNGSHFYTASEAEKESVIANLSAIYSYDGVAYKVSPARVAGSTPVYRFYNMRNGSHFYTASEAEKSSVITNLSAIYALDGVAFFVVP